MPSSVGLRADLGPIRPLIDPNLPDPSRRGAQVPTSEVSKSSSLRGTQDDSHDDGEASCERSPHQATGHPTWGNGRGDEDVGIEDDAHRRLKLRAPCLLLLGPERS